MEKSKIWHDMEEEPAVKYVKIYVLDEDNDIRFVTYDESYKSWDELCNYLSYDADIVAWAYVADIVNL